MDAHRESIVRDVAGNPSSRKKRCPVTLCVPTHRDALDIHIFSLAVQTGSASYLSIQFCIHI
jgi:hypothetical protein